MRLLSQSNEQFLAPGNSSARISAFAKVPSALILQRRPGVTYKCNGLCYRRGTSNIVNWIISQWAINLISAQVFVWIQFSSVTQQCPTVWDPTDCSMPGFPVHHQHPEPTQTHVHWIGDAIQPPHPLSSTSPPTFNLSQHQGLFKWVSFSHQVAKVLEFQLQHQSFQWIFRTDFL